MIQNIAKGYKKLFDSAIKVILLLVACTALGAVIVWPLWKFATTLPQLYTATMLGVALCILLFLLVRHIKKNGAKKVLYRLAKIFVLIAGLCGCVALVLHGKRLFALPVLVAMIVLYGILSFGSEREKN